MSKKPISIGEHQYNGLIIKHGEYAMVEKNNVPTRVWKNATADQIKEIAKSKGMEVDKNTSKEDIGNFLSAI